jgi:7-cyano-7-deazaguanine synthase
VLGCDDVFVGVNALDYSGYPDCRPEYVEAFQHMARLGTERTAFTVRAPLVHLTKAQIIRRGVELGVDYGMTHSCYDPVVRGGHGDGGTASAEHIAGDVLACGRCDSCLLRKKGSPRPACPTRRGTREATNAEAAPEVGTARGVSARISTGMCSCSCHPRRP